ncbi:MAG: aminoacyl-histidine dipeptidase [Candidatus Cloacimonetes bacterium]|nr:aminoacyl-histidine dipeptidase [Candidatus Cloacimonadota bacterium]
MKKSLKLGESRTEQILKNFEDINRIPRKSKHEEEISNWLLNWGMSHGFESIQDHVNNVIIRVPATPGWEQKPGVIFQGHMDMVCVKTADSQHDFMKDSIKHVIKDGWLHADRTTLGADNGIALAIAMQIAVDKEIEHPKLELLFTVDEETGLTGAAELQSDILTGKYLINIDSEDEGVFTIGCAGGGESRLYLPNNKEEVPEAMIPFKLSVGGLAGGHSGITIHRQSANSIKLLVRILLFLDKNLTIKISSINGGTAHNAIPSSAEAIFFALPTNTSFIDGLVDLYQAILKREFHTTDPEMFVTAVPTEFADRMSFDCTTAIPLVYLLSAFPHGVYRMSPEVDGLVETSNNLAIIRTDEAEIEIISSQRSSVMSALDDITDKVQALAYLAKARIEERAPYDAWEPIWDSQLLTKFKSVYHRLFDKKPKIEVIHAGLECGVIGSKYPDLEMISIGPTLRDVHTPDEKLKISDIGKIYDLLANLFQEL